MNQFWAVSDTAGLDVSTNMDNAKHYFGSSCVWTFMIKDQSMIIHGNLKMNKKCPKNDKKDILVRYYWSDRSEILANKISWWSGHFGFHTQDGPKMVQNYLKMPKKLKKGYFSQIFLVG